MATIVNDNKKTVRRPVAFDRAQPVAPTHSAPNIIVVPHPRKSPGSLRPLPQTSAPLPMGQRGSRPARLAKNLSVRSPMIAATLCASFGVSLLCLYVTAYAHVNAEGRHLSQLRQDLKLAERQEIALKSEISRYHLSAPSRAQAMGLISAPPESVQMLTEEPVATTNSIR